MTYNNRGVLFTNDRKEKDSHPDYQGNIEIDGVKKRLAGWKKEKNGKKFLSLQISDFNGAPNSVGSSPTSFIPSTPPSAPANESPF